MMYIKSLRKFMKETRGSSMVEFTLVLPLLILLSLGVYEATNYVLINAKMNEIAQGVASWVSAQTSTATITDCLVGANLMGADYNFSTKGGVVVSGLEKVGTTSAQKLVWQQASLGAASQIVTSSGTVQSAPFTILLATNVIVVEVTYRYQPVFSYFLSIFPSITLYKVAQAVPTGTQSFNPLSAI